MPQIFNPDIRKSFTPPVMAAREWLREATFSPERPLINVSQAAPIDPPPQALRQAIAEAALNDNGAHVYGPVLGLDALREAVAQEWSRAYGGAITPREVAITSGCNQAFCAAVATLARAGDAILLPTPWYFNHKMWLDMSGIQSRLLPCEGAMLPDPKTAAKLIDARTKAILLVTPNNPTGAEYPASLVRAFYELAKSRGIALIIDETYRDFDAREGAPHDLFSDPDWGDTLIHLYSFSKAYRLTGHRVGAMVASQERLAEVEKFLDTVTICPNQLGQRAALFGMKHLGDWLAQERLEILDRRAAITEGFASLKGWSLLGAGAYFAYARHPFGAPSDEIARRLVHDAAILMLPGTMFAPRASEGGDGSAEQQMRIAFANVDRSGLARMFERLQAFSG